MAAFPASSEDGILEDGATRSTQDHLDSTIRTARNSVEGLKMILPYGHPVLTVAITELGKLLAVDEPDPRDYRALGVDTSSIPSSQSVSYPPSGPQRLQLAFNTLLEAKQSALIGFGIGNEGGEVGKDVRESLVRLEREIGAWKEGVERAVQEYGMLKRTGA
jgi:hypothetical protein